MVAKVLKRSYQAEPGNSATTLLILGYYDLYWRLRTSVTQGLQHLYKEPRDDQGSPEVIFFREGVLGGAQATRLSDVRASSPLITSWENRCEL